MYQKGFKIKTSDNSFSITFPKWDFGGDKPWTNISWNNTLNKVRDIEEENYPLLILDLDEKHLPKIKIKDKLELEDWLKKSMK